MSQNTLIQKIKDDAAKSVEEIKAEGTAEVERIQSDIEMEVAELIKTHQADLEKKKAQMELVAVSKAKQAGNIAVQRAKREQIDAIFAAVVGELSGQSAADYVQFFTKYVKDIVPKDAVVKSVLAPKNRLEETSDILKDAGLSGDVKTEASIKAGLVVQTEDGVYDVTLSRLLDEKRAELEMLVVNKVGM